MKTKIVIASITLLSNVAVFAQASFFGQATYESKTSIETMTRNMPRPQGMNITPEMEAQMKERMRKAFEKTYILNFDRTSSTYKEEEKLEANSQKQGGMRVMMSSITGGGGTYFKNVKDKTYTVDKEFMGKEFLVIDTLTNYKWQMTGETKKIGDYTAYKATVVVTPDGSDIRNLRTKDANKDTKKSESKTTENKDGTKKTTTNFFSSVELPSEKTITAWYTPEIPINQGPDSYWGLPGLILEVNDGTTTILCTKITINPKDKVEIKAPKKGKQIPQKEFNEIMMKKMQEMREQFQNGGGRPGAIRF